MDPRPFGWTVGQVEHLLTVLTGLTSDDAATYARAQRALGDLRRSVEEPSEEDDG